jgi:hypothetical protein
LNPPASNYPQGFIVGPDLAAHDKKVKKALKEKEV